MTHGSKSHREHGSTGPGSTPGRTFPGLKSAGHLGNVRRKVRSLQVLKVDTEKGARVVKGSVPGKVRALSCCWAAGLLGDGAARRGMRRAGGRARARGAACAWVRGDERGAARARQ